MNIIVFGFKNCGKGFVGKTLARKLNQGFVDTDDIIEEIYSKSEGENLSYRQIAKKHGMDFFRELEKDAVKRVSALDGKVIAVGGGTPLFFDNATVLKKNSKMVLLRLDKETLFKRIMGNGLPSFLDPKNPKDSFEKNLRERMEKFEEIADFEVDCSNKCVEQVVDEIKQFIEKA